MFTIVMGCDGAGKTAWKRDNYDRLPERHLDQNSLAGGVGDWNRDEAHQRARRIMDDEIATAMKNRRDFGIGSSYSGTFGRAMVRLAGEAGYRGEGVYIGTDSPELNGERIRHRVGTNTGHQVALDRLAQYYGFSLLNLTKTAEQFDTLEVLDNSDHRANPIPEPTEHPIIQRGAVTSRAKQLRPWCEDWLQCLETSLARPQADPQCATASMTRRLLPLYLQPKPSPSMATPPPQHRQIASPRRNERSTYAHASSADVGGDDDNDNRAPKAPRSRLADYMLFVDGQVVGVLEEKTVGYTLSSVELQAAENQTGLPTALIRPVGSAPVPFRQYWPRHGIHQRARPEYEKPSHLACAAYSRAETDAEWVRAATLVSCDKRRHEEGSGLRTATDDTRSASFGARVPGPPPLERYFLYPVPAEAVKNVERSLKRNHPRSLVQIATGPGKRRSSPLRPSTRSSATPTLQGSVAFS